MACEACEHCQRPLSAHEAVAREGYSYHRDCHKCYVCSETNLHNAEVFKGVIFCSSCSQRIFQGCATVRQTKNTDRSSRRRERTKRHERSRPSRRLGESGIIELARLGRSTDSGSYSDHYAPIEKASVTHSSELKRQSIEMGVTTEFTQKLLKEMNCPIVEWQSGSPRLETSDKRTASPVKSPKKTSKSEEKHKKHSWSDLRIAELGASTEIANMALRKHSRVTEMPAKLKPNRYPSSINAKDSFSHSALSDISDEGLEEWLDSTYRSRRLTRQPHWLDRPMRSIMKIPYKYFKSRVLERSSLISVIVSGDNDYKHTLVEKIKQLFREETAEHHRRGARRLYSTIHKRCPPYKLGWLHLGGQFNQVVNKSYKCKHFRCHSYRCLRAQVMQRAGPTKSQLALFRSRLKQLLSLPMLLLKLLNKSQNNPAITASEVGNIQHDPTGIPT